MGWLSRLLGRSPTPPVEQALIVRFQYGSTDLSRLFALEARLGGAIAAAKAGEYDGNEIAADGSEGTLYMYGPDADRLFKTVLPLLRAVPFMKGAMATKRYGPPAEGVREVTVSVDP